MRIDLTANNDERLWGKADGSNNQKLHHRDSLSIKMINLRATAPEATHAAYTQHYSVFSGFCSNELAALVARHIDTWMPRERLELIGLPPIASPASIVPEAALCERMVISRHRLLLDSSRHPANQPYTYSRKLGLYNKGLNVPIYVYLVWFLPMHR